MDWLATIESLFSAALLFGAGWLLFGIARKPTRDHRTVRR
jgi:hypothetical protein